MRTWVLLCFLLIIAGCTSDEPSTDGPASPDTTTQSPATHPPPAPGEWPETRQDTLHIEGQSEPVTAHLYDEEGTPFITYIPEHDFIGEVDAGPEGDRVLFFSNFGGQENRDAYLSFFFPAPTLEITDVPTLRDYLSNRVDRNGWTLAEPDESQSTPCPWAQDTMRFRSEQEEAPGTGYACLGMHNNTPFYLLAHYPLEYGDGFGPRASVLLDAFRWRDSGQGL